MPQPSGFAESVKPFSVVALHIPAEVHRYQPSKFQGTGAVWCSEVNYFLAVAT
jgi:hypothetical protein